jgi:hypothetical protein
MAAPNRGPGLGSAKVDPTAAVRLSLLSGNSQPKDIEEGNYTNAKTPDGGDIEGGALRAGGRANLLSRSHFGFLWQYATVGLVYGLLPETIYPLMQQYLNASGSKITTASTLVVLPWSFKVFYGIVSDCFPIFGYRRRPYMLIGWTICLVMLIVMACSPVGDPYFTNPDDRDIDPSDYTDEIRARINYDAADAGAKYVMLMFFAAFGYVMSDVCADSMTVELAQREPVEVRGKTQTTIYVVRTAVMIFGQILVGFFFNGKEYGGTFDFSLSFPQLMIIVAVLTAPVLPITWFFITEEKYDERPNFVEYIKDLFNLITKRAVYQVIWYIFLAHIFADISYTAASPVQSHMVGVTPINSTLSDILSNLLFMLGLMATSKWGLHWDWRWMIAGTGIFVIIVDCITTMITVWDVFRNQWFWLGPPIAVQLPAGVGWMISTFVIVELAGIGKEGAMYGLMTTVSNVAAPFANSLTLVIDQPFNLTSERIQEDDHSIRKDVTYVVIIMYAMTAFSWVFLILLPKQKEAAQELLRKGGESTLIGAITVFVVCFALFWSVMTNIMAIFPSTACLIIAGGDGC